MNNSNNLAIVRSFIDTWPSLDVDKIVRFFAEDGIYHNMPMQPVQGHAGLRAFIGAFLTNWTETRWEILSFATSGNTVFVERVDRIVTHSGTVDLPCCGVFELDDEKIKVWRDYFDLETYRRATAG